MKITEEGQACRKCGCSVVMKTPKRKPLKPKQTYYYDYYLYCKGCKTSYFSKEAKVIIKQPSNKYKELNKHDLRDQYKEETNGSVFDDLNYYEDEYVFWLETNIATLLNK